MACAYERRSHGGARNRHQERVRARGFAELIAGCRAVRRPVPRPVQQRIAGPAAEHLRSRHPRDRCGSPGGTVSLAQGKEILLSGPQPKVILTGLTRGLPGGSFISVVMNFQNAGRVTLSVPVLPQAQYYSTFSPAPSPTPKATPTGKATATPGATSTPGPSATPTPSPSASV